MDKPRRTRIVIGRSHGQAVEIGDVTVTVIKTGSRGGNVRLAIEAPETTRVLRSELCRDGGLAK